MNGNLYWQKQDRKLLERINKLIEAAACQPLLVTASLSL
jgi:Txe/YoeB family toxin of Txe-Axe toxin-antitoxin module